MVLQLVEQHVVRPPLGWNSVPQFAQGRGLVRMVFLGLRVVDGGWRICSAVTVRLRPRRELHA